MLPAPSLPPVPDRPPETLRHVTSYRCEVCDYVYDEARGEPREGFPAGTPWSQLPDDWCCPDCGVREKVDFLPVDAAGTAP
jgi:rubredoxin